MQLHPPCTGLESRAITSTAASPSLAGGRCHDGMGAMSSQIGPGKHRSISRVFHQVSPTTHTQQSRSPQRWTHKGPNHRCWPQPRGPVLACLQASVWQCEGFVSRLFLSGTHVSPLSLTHCNIVWRAWPALPLPPQAGRLTKLPACLPTYLPMYLTCLLGSLRAVSDPSKRSLCP